MRSRLAAIDEGLEVRLHNEALDQGESVANCNEPSVAPQRPRVNREIVSLVPYQVAM